MDSYGYDRLKRALDFLIVETRESGLDPAQLEVARRFYGGSPTEFLGEALHALESLLSDREMLPPSVEAFAASITSEIRQGFERIGGG